MRLLDRVSYVGTPGCSGRVLGDGGIQCEMIWDIVGDRMKCKCCGGMKGMME